MGRIIATLLVLLFAVNAEAATTYFYVDAGVGSSGAGTSWATAVKTIDEGVGKIAANADVTIRVAPGTYSAEPTGRVSIDSRATAKVVTIIGYNGVDGSAALPTQTTGRALFSTTTAYAVWIKASHIAGTFVWDNIDIATNAAYAVFVDNANSAATLTFQNATLTQTTENTMIAAMDGIARLNRTLIFDNVDFVAPNRPKYFFLNSFKKLWVKNCTFTHAGTTAPDTSQIAFGYTANNTFGDAIFENNTFTTNYYSNVYGIFSNGTAVDGTIIFKNNTVDTVVHLFRLLGNKIAPGVKLIATDNIIRTHPDGGVNHDVSAFILGDSQTATNYLSPAVILRNKMYNDDHIGHSNAVFTGPAMKGGLVAFNSAWGFDQAFYAYGDYATYIYNEADGADAFIIESGEPVSNDVPWATGITYAIGNRVINSAVAYQCRIAHTSGTFATDLAAGNWSLLPKTGTGNIYLFNSAYADDEYPSTGTAGVMCLRDGYTNAAQPTQNAMMYNVIHASGASTNAVATSAHSGTMATTNGNLFDYNLYFLDGNGVGGLFAKDTVQSDTRAPLAFWNWSTETKGAQYNDLNSIIANPNFLSPSNTGTGTARNLRVPSWFAGKGNKDPATAALPTWNDKGAWESPGRSRVLRIYD